MGIFSNNNWTDCGQEGVSQDILKKDYYVTLLLKSFSEDTAIGFNWFLMS